MNSRKKIWKVLFYSLLAVDLGLLVEVCWLSFSPAAQAQTSSAWPELDKNGNPITPESVLALMPGETALAAPVE